MSVSTLEVASHLRKMLEVNRELIEAMRGLVTVRKHLGDSGDAQVLSREIDRIAKASEQMTTTIGSLAETAGGFRSRIDH